MKLSISSLHLSLPMFRTTSKKISDNRYLDKGTCKNRINVHYSCALCICRHCVTQEEWICATNQNGWHCCYTCNRGLLHPISLWLLGMNTHYWLEPTGYITGACLSLVLSYFWSLSLFCDCSKSGKWRWFTSEAHSRSKLQLRM